jgi:hypothetical protein
MVEMIGNGQLGALCSNGLLQLQHAAAVVAYNAANVRAKLKVGNRDADKIPLVTLDAKFQIVDISDCRITRRGCSLAAFQAHDAAALPHRGHELKRFARNFNM